MFVCRDDRSRKIFKAILMGLGRHFGVDEEMRRGGALFAIFLSAIMGGRGHTDGKLAGSEIEAVFVGGRKGKMRSRA